MKIIQDIINELTDVNKTLTNPLLKIKVLASKLKNQELGKFTNLELSGYSENEQLPNYRLTGCNLKGTIQNGITIIQEQPLATAGLHKELAQSLKVVKLIAGVQTMESFAKDNESGMMQRPLSAEMCYTIGQQYRDQGNPYLQILNARKEFGIGAIIQALAEIRTKLLDLMLSIDEIANDIDINNIGEHDKQNLNNIIVQNMKNQFITGDGNINSIGDKNKIKTTLNITKGNSNSLRTELLSNGISEEDVGELIEILENEKPNEIENKPGAKAGNWIKKMIGKSVDGSWQIGLGTAGDLLAQAIGKYYGF